MMDGNKYCTGANRVSLRDVQLPGVMRTLLGNAGEDGRGQALHGVDKSESVQFPLWEEDSRHSK